MILLVLENIAALSAIVILCSSCYAGFYFMKNLCRKCEKRIRCELILLVSILVLAGYGCMIVAKHYSVDSFNLVYDMAPYWHLQLGRYTNCAMIVLALKFNVNQVISQQIFMAIWAVSLIIMIMMIAVAIAKTMKNLSVKKFYLLTVVTSLAMVNVFAMELMLFPEMAMVFIPGNLALGFSVYAALSDWGSVKKWVLSTFFLLIAIGSYQSYIGIFEAFVLIGLFFKQETNIKKRYKESVIALVIGGLVSVFNIAFVKIPIHLGITAEVGRGADFHLEKIISNVKALAIYQIDFWRDADAILPEGIMPLLGILLVVIIGAVVIKLKDLEKQIFFICLIMGCYILGFAAHIIEKALVLSPRSNIAIWSVIAVIIIAGLNYVIFENKIYDTICKSIVMLLVGVNLLIMNDMAADELAMNAVEMAEARQICAKISEYEMNTGNLITKVATTGDSNSTRYLKEARYRNSELGARIMSTEYSNYRLIGYTLGRSLERVDMLKEIYAEYFSGKDWDCMNAEEQIICIGDTLYFVYY